MFDEPDYIKEYYGYSITGALEELSRAPEGSCQYFTTETIRAAFPHFSDMETLTNRFNDFIKLCSDYGLKVSREFEYNRFKVIKPNTSHD